MSIAQCEMSSAANNIKHSAKCRGCEHEEQCEVKGLGVNCEEHRPAMVEGSPPDGLPPLDSTVESVLQRCGSGADLLLQTVMNVLYISEASIEAYKWEVGKKNMEMH